MRIETARHASGWPGRRLARASAALLAALAVVAPSVSRAAAEPALVIEPASGAVLHASDIDQPWYPASLTKMMTLYLAFEALQTGALAPEAALPVSRIAAGQPPTRLGLRAGAKIRTADAIAAVASVSANDAAVVIAEALADGEEAFAARMTAKAGLLGMTGSRFFNATGLPDERQVTTARDMAILGRRLLLDFPELYPAFSRRRVEYAGRVRGAHNRLLGSYRGADGIKTGFTCAAGFNLVASAKRDGRRLLAVVLGGGSAAKRDRRVARLLDDAFARAGAVDDLPHLGAVPVDREARAARTPVRLSGGACARVARKRPLAPGNLPGWGLLLGVFTEPERARAALRAGRGTVTPVAGPGLEVLLRRDLEHGTSWKVLLVGFGRGDAGRACKALWARNATCLVQSPKLMNRRGYEMR